jgi:hypothetical protein
MPYICAVPRARTHARTHTPTPPCTTRPQDKSRQEYLTRLSDGQRELGVEITELTARKEATETERDAQVKKRTDAIERITAELYAITTQGEMLHTQHSFLFTPPPSAG